MFVENEIFRWGNRMILCERNDELDKEDCDNIGK